METYQGVATTSSLDAVDDNANDKDGDEVCWMHPKDILYSQDSISNTFRDAPLRNSIQHNADASHSEPVSYLQALKTAPRPTLKSLLDELKSGRKSVEEITPIRIVSHNGKWYTLDNRRLWVFKCFGERIPVVKELGSTREFIEKFTGNGETIRMRADGDWSRNRLNEEISEDASDTTFLEAHALKWTVKDIFSKRLYLDKVQEIPSTFSSQEQYLDSFRWPLIEETRAQLKQAVEAPDFSHLLHAMVTLEEQDRDMDPYRKFVMHLKITKSEDESSWKALDVKPSDIIILSKELPQSAHWLMSNKDPSILALVQGSARSSNEGNSFIVSIYAPFGSSKHEVLQDISKHWHAIYMQNITTGLRISKALEMAIMPGGVMSLIKETLSSREEESRACFEQPYSAADCSTLTKQLDINSNIQRYCKLRILNDSQVNAIQKVVCGVLCDEPPLVRLVQGPPGTGKTSMLVSLLSILGCCNIRTLVSAPTNIAVCEIAKRFIQFYDEASSKEQIQFAQCCRGFSFGLSVKSLRMGDVVLVGNEDRLSLDVDSPLNNIFLESRGKRLSDALLSSTGSKSTIKMTLRFMTSSLDEYEEYLSNFHVGQPEDQPMKLLQFCRQQIQILMPEVEKFCWTLSNDLPTQLLPSDKLHEIEAAADLARRFLDLAEMELTESEAIECYSLLKEDTTYDCTYQFVTPDANITDIWSVELFIDIRKRMSSILKSILDFMSHLQHSQLGSSLKEKCLKYARIVFSTVSTAGRPSIIKSGRFEFLVIDEASQLVEAETTIVTQMNGLRRALLVGDHKQLPATVFSEVAKACHYDRSLFERLFTLKHPCDLLNVQYRMHPTISSFPSSFFYDGQVEDGDCVNSKSFEKPYQALFGPYVFIDTHHGREEKCGDKGWRNPVEVHVVLSLLKRLHRACQKKHFPSIGIISPYKGQVLALTSGLQSCHFQIQNMDIEVKSVDGFQGKEKDVIIISTVRANQAGNIGFLADYRRLNVAITRGRYCTWIVGHVTTLSSKDYVWKELIVNAKTRKCFLDAGQEAKLSKVIRKVKENLNQMEELLDSNSTLFSTALWKVLFSKEFKKSVMELKLLQNRQSIINKILNLAKGHRKKHPLMAKVENEKFSNIIQVEYVSGLYLVWSVDIQKSDLKQVLKIWDAVDAAHLPGLIRRLEYSYTTYTSEYLERCICSERDRTTKRVIPKCWKMDETFVWYRALDCLDRRRDEEDSDHPNSLHLEKSTVNESMLLMKFYALSSGIARQLLTSLDGSDVELPFEVNEQEGEIVKYPSSCFVIGRSGTGKTTVITTRLLQKEHQFLVSVNGMNNKLQDMQSECWQDTQVHILSLLTSTGSSFQSFQDPQEFDEDVMLDEEEEEKLMGAIPNSFCNLPPQCFPLIITFRKFLAMLDGSFRTSFLKPRTTLLKKDVETKTNFDDEDGNITEDSDIDMDEHSLNSDDFDDNDWKGPHDREQAATQNCTSGQGLVGSKWLQSDLLGNNKRSQEVDFNHFTTVYWPHFNSALTKKLDVSLVYTEIMSQIKGSIEAIKSAKGLLSKEDYLALAERRGQVFDVKQREIIYTIFQQYEKRKRHNREYDIADFVYHLYGQFRKGNFIGQCLHFVYVDEVQDLTQAQIVLLKFVCENTTEGFVFAGDTAQTIARGVGFRFQDIRRLFYDEFFEAEEMPSHIIKSMKGNSKDRSSDHAAQVPDMLQLTQNFRTHIGIVKIANSVVQLLYHFFLNAIDRLDPECSLLCGEIPVFFNNEENHDFITAIFKSTAVAGGGGCEFGSEQVILVRDIASKQRLIEKFGIRGLVLSIHECKGLEFQDVLLYNFFADSPIGNKWRVVTSYSLEHSCQQETDPKMPLQKFDNTKHNALCSELKQLYVALTRARQRLWLYDENLDNHKPMLEYWKMRGLVMVKSLDSSVLENFQGKSSLENWKKKGIEMFNEHQYELAQFCFERADDSIRAVWARAAHLQQMAERLSAIDWKKAAEYLREAGNKYLSMNKGESAAKCFMQLGDFNKAGFIYQESCNPPKFEEAGNCFGAANLWSKAAYAYAKAEVIKKCLHACAQGKNYDLGLVFMDNWSQDKGKLKSLVMKKQTGEERVIFEFLKKGAQYYHQKKKLEQMMEFVNRFPNMALKRAFLTRRDYLKELLSLEEDVGNFKEAAALAEAQGGWELAAKMFMNAGCYGQAVQKMLQVAQWKMLWAHGNKGWPLQPSAEAVDLLTWASRLIPLNSNISTQVRHELKILIAASCPNLQEYLDNWRIAHDLGSLKLELLSGRQLIDIINQTWCLPEDNTDGAVSVPKTVDSSKNYDQLILISGAVWKIWREKVVHIIQAHQRSEKLRDTADDELFLNCSYGILGVCNEENLFILDDCQASWLQDTEVKLLPKQSRRAQINSKVLSNLAVKFWSAQLWLSCKTIIITLRNAVMNLFSLDQCDFPTVSRSKTHVGTIVVELLFTLFDIALEMLDLDMPEETLHFPSLKQTLTQFGALILQELFPLCKNPTHFKVVIGSRNSEAAKRIFTFLATRILNDELYKNSEIDGESQLSYDGIGKIILVLPFLSRNWINQHLLKLNSILIGTVKCRSKARIQLLFETCYIYRDIYFGCPSQSLHERNMECQYWTKNVVSLYEHLKSTYDVNRKNEKRYLSPLHYIELLERSALMMLACSNHLHSVVLPMTWAMNNMTSSQQKRFYTAILRMACSNHVNPIRYLSDIINNVIDLLYSPGQLDMWLEISNLDRRTVLPMIIVRLIVLLITVCVNVSSKSAHQKVTRNLESFVCNDSPFLEGTPKALKLELTKVFDGKDIQNVHVGHLGMALARVGISIGDPLILLKRSAKLKDIAQRWAIRKREISIHEVEEKTENMYVFKSTFSDVMFEPDTKEGAPLSEEVALLATDEDADATANTHDHETAIEEFYTAEAVPIWKSNEGEKTPMERYSDAATSSVSLEHFNLEDGNSIPFYIVEGMRRWLKIAKNKIQKELSSAERHERLARSVFRNQSLQDENYINIFLTEACPLKERVDLCLNNLYQVIEDIKAGVNDNTNADDLLEEFSEHKEDLESKLKVLNPREKHHEECDILWLEKGISAIRSKLAQTEDISKCNKGVIEQSISSGANEKKQSAVPQKGRQNQNKKKKKKKGGKKR